MKKVVVWLIAAMMIAGVASASTLIIPFFVDGGDSILASPRGGLAAFIQLKNLTDGQITVEVAYADMNGDSGGSFTFHMPGGQALGFRPVEDIAADEGVGQDVPNALPVGTLTSPPGAGGVVISATGEIVGSLLGANNFDHAWFSYGPVFPQ